MLFQATLIVELKEKLSTLESSVPPSAPGATSEVHGVKESGSKEGDSGRGSGSPEPTGSSEKHVSIEWSCIIPACLATLDPKEPSAMHRKIPADSAERGGTEAMKRRDSHTVLK